MNWSTENKIALGSAVVSVAALVVTIIFNALTAHQTAQQNTACGRRRRYFTRSVRYHEQSKMIGSPCTALMVKRT